MSKSAIGKVYAIGAFVATPFICITAVAYMLGDTETVGYYGAIVFTVAVVTLFCAMFTWLREDSRSAQIVTPFMSSGAAAFANASPITAEEVLAALRLGDDAFMDDLTAHVPQFDRRHGEPV